MNAQRVWIRTFLIVLVLIVAIRAVGYGTTAILTAGLIAGILTGRWLRSRQQA